MDTKVFHRDELVEFVRAQNDNDFYEHATVYRFSDDGWMHAGYSSQDPYSLILPFVAEGMIAESALVMHGWAAPLDSDEDCMPSQNSQRRRVRVYVHMVDSEWQTSLEFEGGDKVESQGDKGEGMFADAIIATLEMLNGEE